VRLIAYMCPSSLEIDISSSFFLLFWQGDSRKSQDLAWAACSVPRKSDQEATNSEFYWMQGPGIECGLSIGFDAFSLSFSTNRRQLFTVILCLCPPGQDSGISNRAPLWRKMVGKSLCSDIPPATVDRNSVLSFPKVLASEGHGLGSRSVVFKID